MTTNNNNISNKSLYFISLIEILLIGVLFVIKHFAENRMGMMRHVTYWNTIFPEKLMSTVQITTRYIALVVVILIFVYMYSKFKDKLIIFSILMLLTFLSYNLLLDETKLFTYYYGVIATYIIVLLEIIKMALFKKKLSHI